MSGLRDDMLLQKLEKAVPREEVYEIAYDLVSIPSHVDIGDRAVAKYLESLFKEEGVPVFLQPVSDDKHVNLSAIVGPDDKQSPLVMNGHLDTVPPSTRCANPSISGGRLHGRGAADMKGSIAAMVATLLAIRRVDMRLDRPLCFTGVAGEEIGGIGTKSFLEHAPSIEYALVGEPTELRPVVAHKGLTWVRIEIHGSPAHASCPEKGINAVSVACECVYNINSWAAKVFPDRKHKVLGTPSLSIGLIQGGEANNVVPSSCIITLDRRWLPTESYRQVMDELEQIVKATIHKWTGASYSISSDQRTEHCIPVSTPIEHHLVKSIRHVLEESGLSDVPVGVPYGTDAAWFSQRGIPVIIWGPGSIAQAHSDGEYVQLDDLWLATQLYIKAALRLCRENLDK